MTMRDDEPWWNNPARPCKDRFEYSDLTLIKPRPGQTKRMAMREYATSCTFCPVLDQCAADMLTHPEGTRHGIRAGKIIL